MTGCDPTCAVCAWSVCTFELDAFGNTPVIAAVAARLATMTVPAATAIRGCRRRVDVDGLFISRLREYESHLLEQ
jgi:hypothetical protein